MSKTVSNVTLTVLYHLKPKFSSPVNHGGQHRTPLFLKIYGSAPGDGRTFDRRWIFLYREGDNNYRTPWQWIAMNIIMNISLFFCKNHKSRRWRCSVKEGVLKDVANFTGKHLYWRIQHRFFPVKLLGTSILRNICERLLLKTIR